MAITSVIPRGGSVYVYGGPYNKLLFTQMGTLHGYTATNVSVNRSNTIYVYNEKGSLVSTHPCR